MPETQVGDLTVAWDTAGAGPAVVLVHAALGDRSAWTGIAGQVDALTAAGFLVLTYDRRGHGAAPDVPSSSSIATDAADLLGLLDALALPQAALVGHSAGALVALEAALRQPDRAWALALREPPLLSLLRRDPAGTALAHEVDAWLNGVAAAVRAGEPEDALDRFLARSVGPAWRSLLPVNAVAAVAANRDALGPAVRALQSYDPDSSSLAALKVPTLLITDARTRTEARRIVDLLRDVLPQTQAALLGGGEPLDRPGRSAAFNTALVTFLRGRAREEGER